MKSENINRRFLDAVVDGSHDDVYYHFGITSSDPILDELTGLRAVVMAGSRERTTELAAQWSGLNNSADIVAFPVEERFTARYTAGILFASHGMGMPSASIALQELMRMMFFLKRGDLAALDEVFWCRVGTSGGVDIPGGTVVVSTEAFLPDLLPYRVRNGLNGEYWFEGTFPADTYEAIIAANAGVPDLSVIPGKTMVADEFFIEQARLDGAICLATPDDKTRWFSWLTQHGVRNLEMEGAMLAGYLNHWGFPRFAMICCTLLNRREHDQITCTAEQLREYSERAAATLFNYLKRDLLGLGASDALVLARTTPGGQLA